MYPALKHDRTPLNTDQVACSKSIPLSKWLFEELNTGLEVTLAITFLVARDEIHPGIIKMWSHLRRFALYFLHYQPGQHTQDQLRAAQRELFQFGEYAEKNLNSKMLTCLVHRCFAHIPHHVDATLPGAFLREDWGERLIRRTKGKITGHATSQAARASADVCLTEMGLRILQQKYPDIDQPLKLINPCPSPRPQDSGDDYGTQLHWLAPAYTGVEGDEVFAQQRDQTTRLSINQPGKQPVRVVRADQQTRGSVDRDEGSGQSQSPGPRRAGYSWCFDSRTHHWHMEKGDWTNRAHRWQDGTCSIL